MQDIIDAIERSVAHEEFPLIPAEMVKSWEPNNLYGKHMADLRNAYLLAKANLPRINKKIARVEYLPIILPCVATVIGIIVGVYWIWKSEAILTGWQIMCGSFLFLLCLLAIFGAAAACTVNYQEKVCAKERRPLEQDIANYKSALFALDATLSTMHVGDVIQTGEQKYSPADLIAKTKYIANLAKVAEIDYERKKAEGKANVHEVQIASSLLIERHGKLSRMLETLRMDFDISIERSELFGSKEKQEHERKKQDDKS